MGSEVLGSFAGENWNSDHARKVHLKCDLQTEVGKFESLQWSLECAVS